MKILLDLFPAHFQVTSAGTFTDVHELNAHPPSRLKGVYYIETTRIIVTDEVIVVAQDTPTGPVIMFQEKYASYEGPDQSQTYRVVTASGKMLAFKKDTNCGCGSRLRAWNPYKTLSA